MSNQSKNLADLPSFCFVQIFKNIPNLLNLFGLQLVCKKFKQEVDSYLSNHRVFFNGDSFDEDFWDREPKMMIPLAKLLKRCPMLTSLCTNILDFFISEEINDVNDMVYLTELIIDIVSIISDHKKLETFFKKCPNVTNLTLIQFEEFESGTFNFNCLSDKVNTLQFRGVTPQTFIDLMNTKTFNLDSLSVVSHQIYNEEQLRRVLLKVNEKYPELKTFELVMWEIWGPFNLLPKMPSLENLIVYFNEAEISYEAIKDMLESMPNLQLLNFTAFGCPTLDQIIELCTRYCPKMERLSSLDLSSSNYVTENGLKLWKLLSNLQTVNEKVFDEWVNFTPEVDDEDVKK